MAKLLYQGHGSYRITSRDGIVIYVDPYAGRGYDKEADIVLVTHEHYDHNDLSLIKRKDDTWILRSADMLVNGVYMKKDYKDIHIEAVPAYNKNHDVNKCVGYIIVVDNIKIYAAGDTSKTEYMNKLRSEDIHYAILPIDGVYNMNALEAIECSKIIHAYRTIPVHMKPGELFSLDIVSSFITEGSLIVRPNEEIDL